MRTAQAGVMSCVAAVVFAAGSARAQWTNWTRLADPTPSGDLFGQSVAADGHYAIVGADGDEGPTDRGAAYILDPLGAVVPSPRGLLCVIR
jgi:hypothetical protein